MKAVGMIACVALLMGVASAQQGVLGERPAAPLQMKQLDRAQMPKADVALLDQARGRLAKAARIFGYRMDEPGWSCDEVVTPDTPGYLMLVCRRPHASEGGASAFSALIARSSDVVFVVPVLYGGAAPWKTAANMKASREIFNHVVPEKIAAESIQPRGNWMTLALTFTALAGDDSEVLAAPSSNLKWAQAPEPTILLRNGKPMRMVEFSDVSAADRVRYWTLKFNKRGRLMGARVEIRPDLKPRMVSSKSQKWQKLRNLPSPVERAKTVPAVQH